MGLKDRYKAPPVEHFPYQRDYKCCFGERGTDLWGGANLEDEQIRKDERGILYRQETEEQRQYRWARLMIDEDNQMAYIKKVLNPDIKFSMRNVKKQAHEWSYVPPAFIGGAPVKRVGDNAFEQTAKPAASKSMAQWLNDFQKGNVFNHKKQESTSRVIIPDKIDVDLTFKK